jgi:Ger(x)C family germination protein
MIRSGFKLLCLLVLLAFPSGCWNSSDIQFIYFITTIGIDYQDGKFIAYNQVLNFSNIAKSESVQIGKQVPVWLSKSSGVTLSDAMSNAIPQSQMHFYWGHVKAIVLSERVLKHGIGEVIDALNRFRDVRYTVYIFGTKEPLEKVLIQQSIFNSSPVDSLLAAPQRSYKMESKVPQQWSFKFLAQLYDPGNSALLPSLSFSPNTWHEADKPKPQFIIDGAYFFNQMKYAGWMSTSDLIGAHWMQRKLQAAGIPVPDDQNPDAFVMITKPKVKIIPIINGDEVRFRIRLKYIGEIFELKKDTTVDEIEKLAEEAIRKHIRETYLKAVAQHIDVYRLSEVLYRRHPHLYHKLADRDGILPLTANTLDGIDIRIHIKNTGRYKMYR